MKKIFYLASIAALAFSSCAKDETTGAVIDTVGGSKIVAAMEADDTRSELVKDGAGYEIVWKATDGLSVFSNGSGAEALPNVLFQLDNASDGLAAGAFNSKVATLNAKNKYVAVYPYSKGYDFVPTWNRVEYPDVPGYETKGLLDYSKVELTIPATQTYVPGSFDTNTIPAISTEFVVSEENTASVKMQPVVDYLLVDVVATEPIKTLSLNLYKGTAVDANLVKLAGTAPLSAYKVGDKTRYILESGNISGSDIIANKTITLETKQLAGEVSLATPNTYVFVIPGGILGDMNGIVAEIYVNGRLGANKLSFDVNGDGKDDVSNINYYGTANNPIYRSKNADDSFTDDYDDLVYYNYNRENTVFYLNAKNAAGERVPYVYNPNGDVLIEDEIDLFGYFANYAGAGDAYVKEGATFDLSVSHMTELLMEMPNNKETKELRAAISAYIATNGTFPAIAQYNSQFNGNGATISNIERPLSNMGGLFGELVGTSADKTAKVSNLILANIDAATVKEGAGKVKVGNTEVNFTEDYNGNRVKKETIKGVALASKIGNHASISNITVSNLNAGAVLGDASLANFNAIKIGEDGVGEELDHIVAVVTVNGDKSYAKDAEGWEAVSAVAESVFHTIKPAANKTDMHHVITIPEGADHTDLACKINNAGASAVLSVVDGKVSYWTGAKTAPTKMAATSGTYSKYSRIDYAEQLAYMNSADAKAYINTDMVIDAWAGNNWVAPTADAIYGADHTISGVVMTVDGQKDGKVAPFKVADIQSVVFDGITINIETNKTNVVPAQISGLSSELEYIKNVTVNDLVIDAYILDANGNEKEPVYGDETKQRFIGWLTALATSDLAAYNTVVNGVESNIAGLAGMVAKMELKSSMAYFNGCYATDVELLHAGQKWIDEFTYVSGNGFNYAGSIVGIVVNLSGKTASIKFDNFGSDEPIFLYNTPEKTQINVIYNDTVAEELLNPKDEE